MGIAEEHEEDLDQLDVVEPAEAEPFTTSTPAGEAEASAAAVGAAWTVDRHAARSGGMSAAR